MLKSLFDKCRHNAELPTAKDSPQYEAAIINCLDNRRLRTRKQLRTAHDIYDKCIAKTENVVKNRASKIVRCIWTNATKEFGPRVKRGKKQKRPRSKSTVRR